jgi:hydroxymethylpyrimidine pyrophosphatase-like HAD family hydrolase
MNAATLTARAKEENMTGKAASNSLYQQASIVQTLYTQESTYQTRYCLFTDIDGTYIPHPNAAVTEQNISQGHLFSPHIRQHHTNATQEVTAFLHAHSLPIIAVTGRDLASVQNDQIPPEHLLPLFDVIASSVGTEIFVLQRDGSYQPDDDYYQWIEQSSGFDRAALLTLCQHIQSILQEQCSSLQLLFQPHEQDTVHRPFKLSLTFEGTQEQRQQLDRLFQSKLCEAGFLHVHLVISTDTRLTPERARYNLDLVAATKQQAVHYLLSILNCHGITAGDSGNDSTMLFNTTNLGILVGGAQPELYEAIASQLLVRRTRHFAVFQRSTKSQSSKQLMYIEPCSRIGPISLFAALRAYRLLHRFLRK